MGRFALTIYPDSLGYDLQILRIALRKRHIVTLFTHTLDVECDGFSHVPFDFLFCGASRNAPFEIWGIGRIACACLFNHDKILHGFNPACFKILFKVPGAKLSFGLPATVTNPFFVGCLNWLMASSCSCKVPAVPFQPSQDFSNFHATLWVETFYVCAAARWASIENAKPSLCT